jgi:hypothetical protein
MKTFKFRVRVEGCAKGEVEANSKEEAIEKINGGRWDDLGEVDVEDVMEIDHITVDKM